MKIAAALVMTVMFALAAQDSIAADDLTGDCRVGTYRLQDGTDVDIGPTDGRSSSLAAQGRHQRSADRSERRQLDQHARAGPGVRTASA